VLPDLADSTRKKGGSFMNRKIFVLLALSIGVVIFGIGAAANPAPAEKPLFWPASYTAFATCEGVVVTNNTPIGTLYKDGSKWYKLDQVTGEGTFGYNPGGQASGQLKYHWVMTNWPYNGHDETVVWHRDKPAECNPTPTEEPTVVPTEEPTVAPTEEPTVAPTEEPTVAPTEEPTVVPTEEPTVVPTEEPTVVPTEEPTTPPEATQTLVPTSPQPPSGGGGGGTSTGAGPNTSPWGAIALTILGLGSIFGLVFEDKLVAIGKKAITQIRGK
jgi:hypothetical protein